MAYPVTRNRGKLHQFQFWSFFKLSDTFRKVLLAFIPSAPCLKSLVTEYHLNRSPPRSV